jgi:intein/homing endonuclease
MKECNFGLKKWSFPDELFKIKGTKEAWLRAFYSAEGYVNKRYIKNQSINLKSMKKVSSLLKEFGIDNNYYEYLPINKNWSKVAMIFISSKKARISFYEKIGFWHKRKSEKLKESLDL